MVDDQFMAVLTFLLFIGAVFFMVQK